MVHSIKHDEHDEQDLRLPERRRPWRAGVLVSAIRVDGDSVLSDVLRDLGYTHGEGRTPGRRAIHRDGIEVQHVTCFEAWDWLRTTGQVAP